ncbi:Ger(x)C family spore germination protein [Paenibacillus chibensis]|uniref:Ger(X)C family spore germination protein n=1 Tax=Paenibacillus chibensis TaxID=59846 RepID=A0ABU6PNZ4_9BACL|nr:Ger(x)C family spore germination protein [Paenibacillus chibensis]
MKTRLHRMLLLGCLLVLTLPLSGCWDVKDIDNRLLVTVLGIEQTSEEKVRIWVRIPLPRSNESAGGGKGKEYLTINQIGETVVDALDNVRMKLSKSLDLSQIRTIFLDRRLAEKGFLPHLEFSIRDRTLPLDTLVALISGDMETMFDKPYPTGELSGINTKLFFEPYAGGTAQKNLTNLWEVFRRYFNPLEENLVPVLAQDPVTLFKLQGSGYFRGDRMIGMLSPEETLIYEIVTNKMVPFEIETAQKMNVKILKSKAHVHAEVKGNKPVIRIRAKLTMTLMDSASGERIDPLSLQASINRLLEERAARVFQRTQKEQSDIFQLGNHFRSLLPASKYDQWPELYRQASIDFKLESRLENTGLQIMRTPSINPSTEENKR